MEATKMNRILTTESDKGVISAREIITVAVKIIIGSGILFLFSPYTLTCAQDIMGDNFMGVHYNVMPRCPASSFKFYSPQKISTSKRPHNTNNYHMQRVAVRFFRRYATKISLADFNHDGIVTEEELVHFLKLIMRESNLYKALDSNRDGKVDIADVIYQYNIPVISIRNTSPAKEKMEEGQNIKLFPSEFPGEIRTKTDLPGERCRGKIKPNFAPF